MQGTTSVLFRGILRGRAMYALTGLCKSVILRTVGRGCGCPAGEHSSPLRSLRITVSLCKNPTVLGRAWIFSENGHPFVCFADISPVRGITRPYGFVFRRLVVLIFHLLGRFVNRPYRLCVTPYVVVRPYGLRFYFSAYFFTKAL